MPHVSSVIFLDTRSSCVLDSCHAACQHSVDASNFYMCGLKVAGIDLTHLATTVNPGVKVENSSHASETYSEYDSGFNVLIVFPNAIILECYIRELKHHIVHKKTKSALYQMTTAVNSFVLNSELSHPLVTFELPFSKTKNDDTKITTQTTLTLLQQHHQ